MTTLIHGASFLTGDNGKVLGFTIEWGPQRSTIPKSFHPDYVDMEPIIEEVTAGLLAFCLAFVRTGDALITDSPGQLKDSSAS